MHKALLLQGIRRSHSFPGPSNPRVYRQVAEFSQVYLHCGTLEPFVLAPVQAAATGIPCVLSKDAGVAEILQNQKHVLNIDPYCHEDIAESVNRILDDEPLGRQLSDSAVRYVQSNTTWTSRALQILNFLEQTSRAYIIQRSNRILKLNAYAFDALSNIFPNSVCRQFSSNKDSTAQYLLRSIISEGLQLQESSNRRFNFERLFHLSKAFKRVDQAQVQLKQSIQQGSNVFRTSEIISQQESYGPIKK